MDTKRKFLNGWQRLWIVLTALSWLGFAVIFAWLEAHKYQAYEYDIRQNLSEDLANPACQPFSELPFSELTEPPVSDSGSCWSLYTQRRSAQSALGDQRPFTVETYNRNLAQEKLDYFHILFWAHSVGVALVALLVYCAGLAVAWIRRGFAQG